ncbi:NPF8.3, partial [Symbiodinium sp. KB8]
MKAVPGSSQPESKDGPNPSSEDHLDCHHLSSQANPDSEWASFDLPAQPDASLPSAASGARIWKSWAGASSNHNEIRAQVLQRLLPTARQKKEDRAPDPVPGTRACVKLVLVLQNGLPSISRHSHRRHLEVLDCRVESTDVYLPPLLGGAGAAAKPSVSPQWDAFDELDESPIAAKDKWDAFSGAMEEPHGDAGPSAAKDKWDAFSGAMEEPHGDAGSGQAGQSRPAESANSGGPDLSLRFFLQL